MFTKNFCSFGLCDAQNSFFYWLVRMHGSYVEKHKTYFSAFVTGLVLDEIRAVIWPVLATSLVQDSFSDQDTASTASDSDFESAHSNFTYDDDAPLPGSATVVSFGYIFKSF